MDLRLRELAQEKYKQEQLLSTLFELTLAEQWFDLQHIVQHDIAKAVLADYSFEKGEDFLDTTTYYAHWEEVIEIGWEIFCQHTKMNREDVRAKLSQLHENI